MMKMTRNEKSASVDAVITLIETISCKLELVSHDYRRLDALKLELILFHKLLLGTRFFRCNQSSFLFDLFEEVRHFCLILRAERRLEYVMVEEISRFRETLAIYQRRFCESIDTCSLLNLVLDKLRTVDDSDNLGKLKVEVRLIKLLCLWQTNQAGDELPFSKIMCEIYEDATQFYIMLEGSSPNHELVSSFRATLSKCCKQQFSELQSDTFAWSVFQLNEFQDSLLVTLWDIFTWGQSDPWISHLIFPLINAMLFLKTFPGFVTWQIKRPHLCARFLVDFHERPCLSEAFFIHCQVSCIDAARLGHMCWFFRDDEQVSRELQSKSCVLIDKVRPGSGNTQVTQTYIETLRTSTSWSGSSPSTTMPLESYNTLERNTLEYAGHLRDYVFQLAQVISFAQMKGLAKILEQIKTGYVAIQTLNEVTTIVFQLYMLSKKEKIPKELKFRILQLLGNNGKSQLLASLLRKTSLWTPFPRLIVNGVVVSYGITRTEQIKYQLLKSSHELDLIAVVPKDNQSKVVTSLTEMVYRDTEVVDHFKFRAQCNNTSYPYDRKHMLWRILVSISSARSGNYAEMSEEHLGRVLYECLEGKRYLIILKYVPVWRDLISSFPKEGNGSKILLTSSTVSDPAYFVLEPANSIHQARVKMGSCFKGS